MKNTEQLRKQFKSELPKFEQTKEEVLFIIREFIDNSGIKIHSIHSRIKEFDSLVKKSEVLKLDGTNEIFSRINDIIGIRIICLFLSNISEIANLIKKHFDVIFEDNKIDGSGVSSFGYFSVHFLAKLNNEYKGPRYDKIKNIPFEIQVRTISMDAWANISHYLDYKSDVEIPKELKRDFFALSGLFYVADTHFEMFFKNKKEQSKVAAREVQHKLDIEIDYETVKAYINKKFKNREPASSNSISLLTNELIESGYKNIKDLDQALKKYFKLHPQFKARTILNRVGMVRDSLIHFDPKYAEFHKKLVLKRIEQAFV